MTPAPNDVKATIAELYQRESRRVFATLVRYLRDFDLAEEALHESFTVALETWTRDGVPENPRAWLVSTGRFKAVDALRRRVLLEGKKEQIAQRIDDIATSNAARSEKEIEDDRLRLIFTCCHPAIDPKVQVPLTLREVCGLTTDEIASAFLMAPSAMAQRLVRGKSKIRDAGIPFSIPSKSELQERLDSVLSVIYLIFNEGYSASSGEQHTRPDLSNEAIRLAQLVLDLIPDPEVMGLLALMLLHESRRAARTNAAGDIVLLEDQDRSLWNRNMIDEGKSLIARSFASRWLGAYTLQAAISAVHADAASPNETDWPRILKLYDILIHASPSPIVELNRAVAVAKCTGPKSGLTLVDELLQRGELAGYYLLHATRGSFLEQLGQLREAKQSFELALSMAKQLPEKRFLSQKLAAMCPSK